VSARDDAPVPAHEPAAGGTNLPATGVRGEPTSTTTNVREPFPPRSTSAPFVTTIRVRPDVIVLGAADERSRWTLRVQMPEVWDTIQVSTPPSEPVISMKVRALEALFPDADFHEDFVLKLHGWEVLDENASVESAGATDGSIFLLTYRRKRPVR
jgi:hypothetical protein